MFIPLRQPSSLSGIAAKGGQASGRVTARVSVKTPCCGTPLSNIAIYVAGEEKGKTGKDGILELALPPGSHLVTAPSCSNDTTTTVSIEAGSMAVQEVNLTVGSELYLFLIDLSYEDVYKDGVMCCTNISNIGDEAALFLGTASAPGCSAPRLDPAIDTSKVFVPVTIVLKGTSCHSALKSVEVVDQDGRVFEPNEDMEEWIEVFQNDCLVDVLFTGAPVRLGSLVGQRGPRASAAILEEGSRVYHAVSRRTLKPPIVPASWDVRGKPPMKLPKLTRAATWRPSVVGARKPLGTSTMSLPDPRLQKPKIRPSSGAQGELSWRLDYLEDIFETGKKPVKPKLMPKDFYQNLLALAKPKLRMPPGEMPGAWSGNPASKSLLPKRSNELWIPGPDTRMKMNFSAPSLQPVKLKSRGKAQSKHDQQQITKRDNAKLSPLFRGSSDHIEQDAPREVRPPSEDVGDSKSPRSAKDDPRSGGHVEEARPTSPSEASLNNYYTDDEGGFAPETPAAHKTLTFGSNASEESEGPTSEMPQTQADAFENDEEYSEDDEEQSPVSKASALKKATTYGEDEFEDDDGTVGQPAANRSFTYGEDVFEDGGGSADGSFARTGEAGTLPKEEDTHGMDDFEDDEDEDARASPQVGLSGAISKPGSALTEPSKPGSALTEQRDSNDTFEEYYEEDDEDGSPARVAPGGGRDSEDEDNEFEDSDPDVEAFDTGQDSEPGVEAGRLAPDAEDDHSGEFENDDQ